jgi:alpha-tubulin suppressor-like RCC1 family protein/predicted transcriptional regulator
MSVSPSESSSSENYFIDKEELEEKEPEPVPEKQLTKVNSVKNIENYVFENKDVELACQDFLENIFQVNPKQDDPLTQSLTKIRKISDISKSNLHSSGQNSPNAHSKEELNSNSNFNSNQKIDIQSNSSSNKKQNIILNRKDSDKENDSNLANSQNNLNRNNSVSSSGRGIACRNFVDDLLLNNNILPDEHGDELNKVEKVPKKRIIQNQNPNQEQSQSVKENINVDEKGKENDNKKNNNFEMTSEQAKFLMEHKKEIITIQKNWKTYYDVNRFKLLKSKALILQQFYRKYLIKKYNLPSNFYYNDKFLKMQTELYEDTYKKNLSILFPSLFMDKSDLNEFASNMLAMANNPIHSPYQPGQVHLFAKILDFDMMIDTNECYETLWASIYDSIYTRCLQNNDPIQLISLGSQHTVCVTNKGKIYTFGWNNYGQCGVPINSTVILKNELNNNRLININKFNEIELRILNRVDGVKIPQIDEVILSNSITCGEDYTLIVDKEGKLWSFGLNLNGQLGLGHCVQIDKPSEVELENEIDSNQIQNKTFKKSKKNKVKFNSVKSAGYINFCTTEQGEIYMWPWGDKQGNLHYNPNKFFLSSPQEKVISVACGNNFCVMLNNNGMVYSMGKSNKYGELGVGDFNPRYAPTPIDFFNLNLERINQISCGFKHCVAKSTTGRVYTWGCGCKGQLGQDNYNNMSIPGLVRFEDPFMKIIQVSAGFRCTFFLSDNRKVFSCGCNGTISMEKTPVLFDIVDKVPEMSLEQNYSVVRINNTWCKSFSIFYATVADTTTLKLSPVRISSILNNLASKWINDNINPPYVETIENFFPINVMKKPKKNKI